MSLQAVDKIEDALDRSKEIILPFNIGTWARLAIIVLFIGGSGATNIFTNIPTSLDSGSESLGTSTDAVTGMATAPPSLGGAAIGGIIVGFVSLLAVFMYLSSVFQFVMFRSMREKEVAIRKNFKKHYIDGAKYLLFMAAYLTVFLGVTGGAVGAFFLDLVAGILAVLLAIPILIVLTVFGGVVHDFALQRMIEERVGLIQAIRESLSEVTEDWKEFGGYVLFRLLVSWITGALFFMATLVMLLALGLPLGLIVIALLFIFPPAGVLAAIISTLIWMAVILYAAVPFRVYKYCYFVELYEELLAS